MSLRTSPALSRVNVWPWFIISLLLISCQGDSGSKSFTSYWDKQPDRSWIGPEYWANRLQDWRLSHGRLECINAGESDRTLHLLTRHLTSRSASFSMEVSTGFISPSSGSYGEVYTGFLIGAGSEEMDHRRRALVHGTYGNSGGLIAGVSPTGGIRLIDNQTGEMIHSSDPPSVPGQAVPGYFRVEISFSPGGNNYRLLMRILDPESDEIIQSLDTMLQPEARLDGNLALISNGSRSWFRDWFIEGSKLRKEESYGFGPVMGTQYTLAEKTLRLTAQLAPISESDEQLVYFQLRDAGSGRWRTIEKTQITMPGYLACFRIKNWNDEIRHDYRIGYRLNDENGRKRDYYYYGVIVQDPAEKEELVLAAFTGNSNSHGSIGRNGFDFSGRLWFPHEDLTARVAKHGPDLLFFSGDNVYEGRPTPPDFSSEENTRLDYLYKWYLFFWAHGELTRNIPCISIPDDHDVYHGNIWGDAGSKAPQRPSSGEYPEHYRGREYHWQQDQGGYKLSPALVNMIQKTQVSHLPPPFDPEPVKQGIEVYYCNLNYGRISWAILEDRKFKSAPSRVLPEYRVVNGFSQVSVNDGRVLDRPEASLLGERQLDFIREWAADWRQVDLKVALSQSIFANLSTYPDSFETDAQTPRLPVLPQGEIPKDYRKAKDMDSNGWPQSGRNKALKELRKGFATMVGGDQHLGSVIHHGIDDWEDAGYSFCVPSIANLWPRRWFPPQPGEAHRPGLPAYTGRYLDGFGNRVSVHAVSNPYVSGKEPRQLHDRAPGYGIIRLNKSTQKIIFECWPRHSDPESANAEQYPGWPVSFDMQDNFSRDAGLWLPTVEINGLEDPPVVQVINEDTEEIIYTLRLKSFSYQPGVFEEGVYTLKIGEPGSSSMQILTGLSPAGEKLRQPLTLTFR